MNLNQLFDVVRGFNPDGSGPSISESFAPKGTLSNSVAVVLPGMIVTMYTDGTMDVATTPNRSTTSPLPTWMCVMGNDFDNSFVGKFVAVRGNVMVKTDQFAAGSYGPGKLVSFSAGLLKLAATNDQIIGEVMEDNRTTGLADGTMTVMYTGGGEAML